jgi:hypothetical protein
MTSNDEVKVLERRSMIENTEIQLSQKTCRVIQKIPPILIQTKTTPPLNPPNPQFPRLDCL